MLVIGRGREAGTVLVIWVVMVAVTLTVLVVQGKEELINVSVVMSGVRIMVTVTDGTNKVEMSTLEEASGFGIEADIERAVSTSKLWTGEIFSGEIRAVETSKLEEAVESGTHTDTETVAGTSKLFTVEVFSGETATAET